MSVGKHLAAPLRLVVERVEAGACDLRDTIEEIYECGHVEHYAPSKPAKRRRCMDCLRRKPAVQRKGDA